MSEHDKTPEMREWVDARLDALVPGLRVTAIEAELVDPTAVERVDIVAVTREAMAGAHRRVRNPARFVAYAMGAEVSGH